MFSFCERTSHQVTVSIQAMVLAGALLVQVACGSDTAIEGPGLLVSEDGSASGDGAPLGSSDGAGGPGGKDVSLIGNDSAAAGDALQPDGAVAVQDGMVGDSGAPDDAILIQPDGTVTDPTLSCQGKCGQAQTNKWKCQCDAQCAQYGDCCADYKQVCGTVGPGPGPGPDAGTTPAQIISCLEKACAPSVAVCTQDKTCNQFWNCAKQCNDEKCMQKCASSFDIQKLAPLLQPLMTCGENSGCTGSTTQPSGPVCGDGTCEQPENSLNCIKDCPNQPAGEVQQCLAAKCPSQYKACFGDSGCVAAVACMNTGKQPQQCVSDQKTGQLLSAMLSCGGQVGCLSGTTSCGNGKCDAGESAQTCPSDCKAPSTCGNGKCDAGESSQNCPKDCPVAPSSSCQNKCGQFDPKASCQCNTTCAQAGNCCKDYKTYCGTTTATCQGKCGQFSPGAACQCNAECKVFGNCCPDWEKLCSANPTPVCGDGVCTAPAESSATCPKDCGEPPAPKCKTKADCADAEICCGKADGTQVCTPAGKCF